jgi:hypothetical protein
MSPKTRLVRGGQGRSAKELRETSWVIGAIILAVVLVAIILCAFTYVCWYGVS